MKTPLLPFGLINFISIILFSSSVIAAEQPNASKVSFEQCLSRLQSQAKAQGFSNYITDKVISQIEPLKNVIKLDQTQPEFAQSFEQYVALRVSNYHVKHGKKRLKQHALLFRKLTQQYGIPAQYLVSFWGLETVFGKHKGKMDVLNAITTLACDERRKDYFTAELFDLFYLLDNKTVSIEQLKGSWAGAMGHMQFMPSALRQYALDGDKDGKIDVWGSEVDALVSAANYLNKIGWQPQEKWGRQVLLPQNFAFEKVEFDRYYPLSTFKNLGIKTLNNQPLSNYDIEAELVLPSGYTGSAFLVYPNFNVIMDWNLSKNYALSVGLLADKLIGQGEFVASTKPPKTYSRVDFIALQQSLNQQGFDAGKADGIWGPKSRKAIRLFQLQNKLVADGFPQPEVFQILGITHGVNKQHRQLPQ